MIKTTVQWTNGQPHSAPQLICDGCDLPVHPHEGICFCYPAGTDLYIVHQGVCARTLAAILRPDDRPPHWLPIEHALRPLLGTCRSQVYDTVKRLKF